jgi:transcription termination factor NusB
MKMTQEQRDAKFLAEAIEILKRYGRDFIANLIQPILDNMDQTFVKEKE